MNILEAEIKELTADRSELEYKCMDRLHEIEQLKLDNEKLREALEYQLTRTDDITDIRLIGEALSTISQPVVLNNQTTQKPLSDEEIMNIKVKEGLGNWYNFARAIEKRIRTGE